MTRNRLEKAYRAARMAQKRRNGRNGSQAKPIPENLIKPEIQAIMREAGIVADDLGKLTAAERDRLIAHCEGVINSSNSQL